MWHLCLLALGSPQLRVGPIMPHVDSLGTDVATGSPYLMTVLNYTFVSNTSDVMVVGERRIALRPNVVIRIPYKVRHHVEAAPNSRREFHMTAELDEVAVNDPIALVGTCSRRDTAYGVDGSPLTYDECRRAAAVLKTGMTTSTLAGDGCFVVVDRYATRLHFTSVPAAGAIAVRKCDNAAGYSGGG